MSEDKYDKLLNAAIVLLIASAAVLGYSVYNSHFSKSDIKTSADNSNSLRDSLKTVYSNAVTSIDTNLVRTNTEANPELESKYKEVDALRAEINRLLLSNDDANFATAQQKILELQLKITTLEIRYEDASEQNRKLQEKIVALKTNEENQNGSEKNDKSTTVSTDTKKQTTITPNTPIVTAPTKQQINQASEMSFYATTNKGENQTTKILNSDKLQGSFLFKYKSPYAANDAVYIVVIQPDGKTIKGPSWDIGVFDSDEGKKVFTKKINVELNGQPLKLDFSVLPDEFLAGSYTMEIWYKKNLIGTKVRTLL